MRQHQYNDFIKVSRVINSCNSKRQLAVARNMISGFASKHRLKNHDFNLMMLNQLLDAKSESEKIQKKLPYFLYKELYQHNSQPEIQQKSNENLMLA
jgi:hypothetical protein